MSKKRLGSYTSYSDVAEEVEKALAEIKDILQQEKGPLTVRELRESMQADTRNHFEEARAFGERTSELYIHQKGIVDRSLVESLSIDERITHIKWCLGLHEVSARQYLQDKPLLLQVPSLLKRLREKHGKDFPRWRDEVYHVINEALMMRNTLEELSVAYGEIEGGCRELLGSPKVWRRIGSDLSDLDKVKAELQSQPFCKHCGSFSVRLIGKHKDVVKCHDCGRMS